MTNDEKKRRFKKRRLIMLVIFAASVLALPTRFMIEGIQRSGAFNFESSEAMSAQAVQPAAGSGTAPIGSGIADAPPVTNGKPLDNNDATPDANGTASGTNGTLTGTIDTPSGTNDALDTNGTPPVAGGTHLAWNGTHEASLGNAPTGTSGTQSNTDGTPSNDDKTPGSNGSQPGTNLPPPAADGSKPSNDNTSPGTNGTPSDKNGTSPVGRGIPDTPPDRGTSGTGPRTYKYLPDSAADPANGDSVGGDPAGESPLWGRSLPPENVVITISAIGDCTIGYDETSGYQNRFDQVYASVGGDPAYFFSNVFDIFSNDDLTIANLETVFTNSKNKANKTYRFRGPPEYVAILESGSIEAVNLANNHMYDYFQKGYDDTIETLKNSEVQYFGYDNRLIFETRGVKIGLAGFHIGSGGWSDKKKAVTEALNALRGDSDIVIMSFHWGIEGKYKPTGDQRSLAHYCIDNGADMVIGHHPHTLQTVEQYNGRTIAYSLGNFCFGGNRNPTDKDSIILQQSFEFDGENLELLEVHEPEIIPVSVSSVSNRNDYKPTVVEGAAAERILKKVAP